MGVGKQHELWRNALNRGETVICGVCNLPIPKSDEPIRYKLTVDHIIPKVNGGTNQVKNLQPAHHKCNGFKGNSSPYKITDRHHKFINEVRAILTASKSKQAGE